MDAQTLVAARENLLAAALERFAPDPDVVGIFLGGSLAAGAADAYSDIDLRVVVRPEAHAAFVARRLEIPKDWPGFLFNEWLPGAQHCVSHFRPFGKIDIFYLSRDALKPSPWYALPTRILHDPAGVVADLRKRSEGLAFVTSAEEVERSIAKGLAAARETYRRTRRGELVYAYTLLDELRHRIIQADDWLHGRTPVVTHHAGDDPLSKAGFDARGSREAIEALAASYCAYDAAALEAALARLVRLYRSQVIALHEAFPLARPLENDLAALDVVVSGPASLRGP